MLQQRGGGGKGGLSDGNFYKTRHIKSYRIVPVEV